MAEQIYKIAFQRETVRSYNVEKSVLTSTAQTAEK
jgi:hypothetical protein